MHRYFDLHVAVDLQPRHLRQEIQDSVSHGQLECYNAEDREVVEQFCFAALHLPQLNIAPEPIRPFDRPLHIRDSTDFSSLIALRLAHQTKYAAKSVRTKSKTGEEDVPGSELVETPTDPKFKTPSARQELKTKLDKISRRYVLSDRGPTSELTRQAHWNTTPLTGNSANAALASGKRAIAVSSFDTVSVGSETKFISDMTGDTTICTYLRKVQASSPGHSIYRSCWKCYQSAWP